MSLSRRKLRFLLRGSRGYFLLWGGQSISAWGDQFHLLGIILLIHRLGTLQQSCLYLTGYLVAQKVTPLLLSPILASILNQCRGESTHNNKNSRGGGGGGGGEGLRRYGGPFVVLICDCLRVPLALAALLITTPRQLATVLGWVCVARAVIGGVHGPARRQMLPVILPPKALRTAALVEATTHSVVVMAGNLTAALVVWQVGVKWCFILDALSFAISFLATVLHAALIAPRLIAKTLVNDSMASSYTRQSEASFISTTDDEDQEDSEEEEEEEKAMRPASRRTHNVPGSGGGDGRRASERGSGGVGGVSSSSLSNNSNNNNNNNNLNGVTDRFSERGNSNSNSSYLNNNNNNNNNIIMDDDMRGNGANDHTSNGDLSMMNNNNNSNNSNNSNDMGGGRAPDGVPIWRNRPSNANNSSPTRDAPDPTAREREIWACVGAKGVSSVVFGCMALFAMRWTAQLWVVGESGATSFAVLQATRGLAEVIATGVMEGVVIPSHKRRRRISVARLVVLGFMLQAIGVGVMAGAGVWMDITDAIPLPSLLLFLLGNSVRCGGDSTVWSLSSLLLPLTIIDLGLNQQMSSIFLREKWTAVGGEVAGTLLAGFADYYLVVPDVVDWYVVPTGAAIISVTGALAYHCSYNHLWRDALRAKANKIRKSQRKKKPIASEKENKRPLLTDGQS